MGPATEAFELYARAFQALDVRAAASHRMKSFHASA
jgi:hypothetical protein